MKKKNALPAVLGPISALTLAFSRLVPVFSSRLSSTLDSRLGKGDLVVENPDDGVDYSYYDSLNPEAAYEEGKKITEKIAEEGIVLLKNENCLPLAQNEILSPFGYGYSHDGFRKGSASWDGQKEKEVSIRQSIRDFFSVQEDIEKITRDEKNVLQEKEALGTSPTGGKQVNGKNILFSRKDSAYMGRENKRKGTIGFRVLSRDGGEGDDFKMDGYASGSKHALQLTGEERNLLRRRKQSCKKTILLYTGINPLEINEETDSLLDAILYLPGAGTSGNEVIGKVLAGKVNPSGRTVDTWTKDFLKIPSSVNYGLCGTSPYQKEKYPRCYSNAYQLDGTSPVAFVEYKEGIYVGYRYYETADKEGIIHYKKEVAYPFGYGLSYSSFRQEFLNPEIDFEKGILSLSVQVENTGKREGKEAIQIYYDPPYTSYDKENGIEKASKNLILFDKTNRLKPGESQILHFTIDLEDRSSYFSQHQNQDGTRGCYFLEDGSYSLVLGKNSHDEYDSFSCSISDRKFFEGKNLRKSDRDAQSVLDEEGKPVSGQPKKDDYRSISNRFEPSNRYRKNRNALSRKDFSSTYPTAPSEKEQILDKEFLEEFNSYKSDVLPISSHPLLGDEPQSKVYDNSEISYQDNSLVLSSFRGVDNKDERWDSLLDQISFSDRKTLNQIGKLLGYGAYHTSELDAVNKFSTEDYDGPNGVSTFGKKKKQKWCDYSSETLTACTYNPSLSYERGKAMGKEALKGNVQGLYAPGVNIHRSPFGGRNAEYFSEDPYRSGRRAAEIISGVADGGAYTYRKHFARNEQDTGRNRRIRTWADEQTRREIYLKPFEICAKKARQRLKYFDKDSHQRKEKIISGCRGVRTSFNCIGPIRCSRNYSLCVEILRNEWGFQGRVVTDYSPQAERDAVLRSGNDRYRTAFSGIGSQSRNDIYSSTSSLTFKNCVRRAIKNICYAVVNSGAYNGIAPQAKTYRKISAWQIWIHYVLTGVLLVLTLSRWTYLVIWYFKTKKKPVELTSSNS